MCPRGSLVKRIYLFPNAVSVSDVPVPHAVSAFPHLSLELLPGSLHEVGVSGVRGVSRLEGVHDVGVLLGEFIADLASGQSPPVQPVVVPLPQAGRSTTSSTTHATNQRQKIMTITFDRYQAVVGQSGEFRRNSTGTSSKPDGVGTKNKYKRDHASAQLIKKLRTSKSFLVRETQLAISVMRCYQQNDDATTLSSRPHAGCTRQHSPFLLRPLLSGFALLLRKRPITGTLRC